MIVVVVIVVVVIVVVVIVVVVIVVIVVVMVVVLHPLHGFFFPGIHPVQQRQGMGLGGRGQNAFRPAVGFPAHVYKQIASLNGRDVRHGGLIVMQIRAVIHQQGQRNAVRILAQNLAHPVVGGEGGADDRQGPGRFSRSPNRRKATPCQQNGQQARKKLLHVRIILHIRLYSDAKHSGRMEYTGRKKGTQKRRGGRERSRRTQQARRLSAENAPLRPGLGDLIRQLYF